MYDVEDADVTLLDLFMFIPILIVIFVITVLLVFVGGTWIMMAPKFFLAMIFCGWLFASIVYFIRKL